MFTKASVVAIFASIAAAQLHAPVGEPSGNPITRPLNEVVPACKAFTITWQPTTTNTVSLLLLRGPSTNVVPIQTLVEGINNSGSFVWTPASTLEADTTHYGLQLIDDVNGQYQYSTQFGISKADCAVVVSSSSSAAPVASSTPAGHPVASSSPAGYPVASSSPAGYPVKSSPAGYPVASSSVVKSSPVAPYPTTVKTVATSSAYVAGTGAPAHNSTIMPTGSMTVPSSLRPSATGAGNGTSSATLPESTGAAGSIKAGLSLVGAAALAALML
ncbi:uncharacterized protein M421DRAFT_418770 [Didymella exigua CBS 183.55]|uniref:Yeast cell wall synthesis Kre9/Knh1-like N-terminal domain-containing protein n=1 Tax=Didymella exigua CBS 183.55 TaxID=1150837 RepID=A0A6A5RPT9_9PLEO|nr:uncharacterized protein M421DRAFT_418770 [Didymella exigua CBS 183.55]KAF1930451.1 hypothetical protein M421DRAFT_418770 [Didymella exigua CBS 183.55]